jgi:hypothetical protein
MRVSEFNIEKNNIELIKRIMNWTVPKILARRTPFEVRWSESLFLVEVFDAHGNYYHKITVSTQSI